MKKIINSTVLIALFLASCGENKEQATQQIAPLLVTSVVGIGKVLPLGGITELSVQQSNRVVKLFKQLGDTVRAGEVLFLLEADKQNIQVQQSQVSLQAATEQWKAANYDIDLAQLKLADLRKEWEISKQLFAKKAETAQKVFQDSIAYHQQLAVYQQKIQAQKAQQTALNEQKLTLENSKIAQQDQSYKALQDGILIRFDVTLGSVLAANTTFGELAPLTNYIVEGELDEYYAPLIKEGQSVAIVLVGQTEVVANGILSFVGAGLQNKSILYETIGEGSDRRVRRFTVKITDGQEHLLINQKVECKINL